MFEEKLSEVTDMIDRFVNQKNDKDDDEDEGQKENAAD